MTLEEAVAEALAVPGQPQADQCSLKPIDPAEKAGLTSRERDVLRLLASGMDNAQIAHALSITISTVKAHINHIFGKLSVHNRLEAVLRAQELDLL